MASSTSWIKNLDVIDDLPSLLDRLLSLQAAENKPRPVQYAFRGVANKTWSLTPSVSRIPGINHTASGLRIERQQIENFRRDAWRFLGPFERQFLNITLTDLVRTKPLDHKLKWESEGIWSALAIARHYGAPTRLLDWTHNVLFAAYFAACSEPEMDGAIWWFDQTEFETVVADMWDSWGVNIRDDGSKQRAIELSAFVPDAAPWISKVHHDVPFTRMERQKGFFTACGRLGISHDTAVDNLARAAEISRGRVVIPAALKELLLNALERIGINAQTLDYPGADMAMMKTSVNLDASHFQAVSKLAKKKKISISQLVQLLIDAANQSFDEILSPVREDFRKGGMTEVQLDERVGRARKKVLAKSRGKSRKSTMGGNIPRQ